MSLGEEEAGGGGRGRARVSRRAVAAVPHLSVGRGVAAPEGSPHLLVGVLGALGAEERHAHEVVVPGEVPVGVAPAEEAGTSPSATQRSPPFPFPDAAARRRGCRRVTAQRGAARGP